MEILDLTQSISKKMKDNGSKEKTITAILSIDGEDETLIIRDDHANWNAITNAIEAYSNDEMSEEELAQFIYDNYNIINKVEEKFTKVSDVLNGRMTIQGNTVMVDYDTIDPALELHILRLLKEDGTPKDRNNWRAFSKFIEKLYSNTNEHVRQQLFGWLSYENTYGRGFTLTKDGDFIGYKGCCAGADGVATSIHSGPAIVDGVSKNGHIPNAVGSVIEMPRTKVQHDPAVGCSSGLHVGTYDYAQSFAQGIILTVSVNPADVVSVPTECEAQKIRTCRYKVLDITKTPHMNTTYYADDEYDDDYDEYDNGYDEDYDNDYDGDDEMYDTNSNLRTLEDYQKINAPVDNSNNNDKFNYDDLREDDEVQIFYRRSDGRTNTYDVTIKIVGDTCLEGILTDDGGYRRFTKNNILSLKRVNFNKVTVAEDTTQNEKQGDKSEYHPGQVVNIVYRKVDNTEETYVIEIENVKNDVIVGVLLNGNGYRSFKMDRIVSIREED